MTKIEVYVKRQLAVVLFDFIFIWVDGLSQSTLSLRLLAFVLKDLKNQFTTLSEENISLESHAKKLQSALKSAEEAQEVTKFACKQVSVKVA